MCHKGGHQHFEAPMPPSSANMWRSTQPTNTLKLPSIILGPHNKQYESQATDTNSTVSKLRHIKREEVWPDSGPSPNSLCSLHPSNHQQQQQQTQLNMRLRDTQRGEWGSGWVGAPGPLPTMPTQRCHTGNTFSFCWARCWLISVSPFWSELSSLWRSSKSAIAPPAPQVRLALTIPLSPLVPNSPLSVDSCKHNTGLHQKP